MPLPIGIEGPGTIISFAAANIGEVVDINYPADEAKEFGVTAIGDPREVFKISNMSVGQELVLSILLNPVAEPLSKGDQGEFVISLNLQDPTTNNTKATRTFSGYVRIVGGTTASTSGTDGLVQDITVRLNTEIVSTVEQAV